MNSFIYKKVNHNSVHKFCNIVFKKFFSQSNDYLKFDVAIVGGGISGLSTAIRLKQLAKENNRELSVAVFEKGNQIGSHVLSGCIMDPIGLDTLLPNWRELEPPEFINVTNEKLVYFPNNKTSFSVPRLFTPEIFKNDGNMLVNLTNFCEWMSLIAMDYGVDIFDKSSVVDILHDTNNRAYGVQLGDYGKNKNDQPKSNYQKGTSIISNYTIIAEGVRGNNSIEMRKKHNKLYQGPIPHALGIKEIWDISANKNVEPLPSGTVYTIFGYPNMSVGGFMYQFSHYLHLGFIYPLNYKNANISIYEEMQKFKLHPLIHKYIDTAKIVNYGAKSITEGGVQTINDLHFPGGCLIGECSGLIDNARLKGSHLGILSGVDAANSIWHNMKGSSKLIGEGGDYQIFPELTNYSNAVKSSDYYSKLSKYKNLKAHLLEKEYLKYYTALLFPTLNKAMLNYKHWDHEVTTKVKTVEYPKHNHKTTFDKEENLFNSGLHYNDDQPCHLKVLNDKWKDSYRNFGGLEEKLCPANVYEYTTINGELKLIIHNENCLQCKACTIKFPNQFIKWTPPEGGSGPRYNINN